jgi:8-oxo-dGTP pyrophosphatase MutT (NUDIX family)
MQPRDAATVMLVRDSDEGLETFMLQRRFDSAFVGGAHVFPGGAVDPDDRGPGVEGWCEGRSDVDASRQLGVPSGGLGFWVAAVRECFEEAGVLLAYDGDGAVLDLAASTDRQRFAEHRRSVDGGGGSLAAVCDAEGLRLATDAMHYLSHWVTPEGSPRRYDTRFFVTEAPAGQVPSHDEHETIADMWTTPAAALDAYARGDVELIMPTLRTLEVAAEFASAAALLAAVERPVDEIPDIVPDELGRRVALPGIDVGSSPSVSAGQGS